MFEKAKEEGLLVFDLDKEKEYELVSLMLEEIKEDEPGDFIYEILWEELINGRKIR